MYGYNAKNLAAAFRTVRKNTIQIAEEIPEDKYDFRPTEGARSVGETLKHLAISTAWPLYLHGQRISQLNFAMFTEMMAKTVAAEALLHSKADILKALHENGEEYARFLDGMSDEALEEMVSYPPEANQSPKSRFEMLLSPKEHEMHHRGQLMVMERMLGITPHLTRQMNERMAALQQQRAAHGA